MTLKVGCATGETVKRKVGYMGGGTGGEEETVNYFSFMCLKGGGLGSPHLLRNAPQKFQTAFA